MLGMDRKMEGKKFSKNKPNKFSKKTVKVFKKKLSKRELFLQEADRLKKAYEEIDSATAFETFEQLPLTSESLKGLKQSGYVSLTDIQRESIVLALKGHDILGAAKTGSGKTLAFVIPVLECLFQEAWSKPAGLGAVVITPTRELAYQIFNVFKKVGKFHDFTVALVIGGKDLEIERKILNQFNIVICTPGRLLQHMDENPLFDSVSLQILVLDEADRILDLGFAKTMNAILENLPQERQTLLFSATQTKSVKDLARLSLKDPKYVSVHEHAKYVTPESLMQSYIVMKAENKVNFLWSFLKKHKKKKILVFMASCKQVKYTFEVFCKLRPGISVTALYGSLHQLKRMEKYNNFCRKEHVVMFATDIAARGLDFPNVNWVIQLDCPEDVNTYIHRAGRTARYCKGGESLLVLLPSERDSMLEQMEARRIPITEIQVNPRELSSITKKMITMCCNNSETSETAKRAFNAYLKSIFLMKDKTVFDVQKVNTEAYARSLGLLVAPRTRFINRHLKTNAKFQPSSAKDGESSNPELNDKNALITVASESENKNLKSENESAWHLSEDSDGPEDFVETKPQQVLEASVHAENTDTDSEGEDVQDGPKRNYGNSDFDAVWNTTVSSVKEEEKKVTGVIEFLMCEQDTVQQTSKKTITKFALAKKILKSGVEPNRKIVYDDEEEEVVGSPKVKTDAVNAPSGEVSGRIILPDEGSFNLDGISAFFCGVDKKDRETYKSKVKEKHREKRKKLKRKRETDEEDQLPEDSQDVSSKQGENNLQQYINELPDPDKYFGRASESDEGMQDAMSEDIGGNDDDREESMSEDEQPKQKQKKTKKEKLGFSRKKLKLSTLVPSDVESTLGEDVDEDLALTLLQGS